ncbi:MAG: PepSY-like domain-containing protein [Bacteroidota bacterium]
MKRVIVPMLLLATAIISCSKHDSGAEQTISVADLPKSVISYVDNNYPAESIYKAVKVHGREVTYSITLTSDEQVYFDKNGGFAGEGMTFLHKGEHHHGKGHHHHGVPSDSLSTVVKNYIATNYAGYTFRHAETDSICSNGLVTQVVLFKPGSTPIKLYFSSTGSFLMQGTRVPSSDLPQAVKTTIASNFTGYSLTEKSEKYILADNFTVEYFVFLVQGEIRKHLIIKEDGTVVCIQ